MSRPIHGLDLGLDLGLELGQVETREVDGLRFRLLDVIIYHSLTPHRMEVGLGGGAIENFLAQPAMRGARRVGIFADGAIHAVNFYGIIDRKARECLRPIRILFVDFGTALRIISNVMSRTGSASLMMMTMCMCRMRGREALCQSAI